MFKAEYQGGPFVDVFSAQGRDALSKKCKVTGTSTNIHKQYDKDVKSYVYVLEGEPTTSKIQFPKEDKQGLFLTQKFLVFQLFLPVGRPFSFEVAVTDHAQNKRRIFFSSNLKDISVTPLHARFPLAVLNIGSWLNLCLDLDSLVSETFNGPKFRAVESFTVTANCRLKKVFTLRAPPEDTSEDESHDVFYANSEPLPKNLQLMTTSNVSTITQILSYGKLCGKHNENLNSPLSTSSGHEGSTPRQDQETHIAFGTKVVKPPHVRRNSLKENRENTSSKIPYSSRLSSSKTKHGQSDVGYTHDGDSLKSPLSPKGNRDAPSDAVPKGIDANQATIQPRPPRSSSAGKTRRPIRLKSSSAGKTRTKSDSANDKEPNAFETEKSSASSVQKLSEGFSRNPAENLVKTSPKSIEKSIENHELDQRIKSLDINDEKLDRNYISSKQELRVNHTRKDELENHQISNSPNSSQTCISRNINTNANAKDSPHIVAARSSKNVTDSGERTPTTSEVMGRLTNEHASTNVNSAQSENRTEKNNQMRKKTSSNADHSHASKISELSHSDMDSTHALVKESTNRQSFDNVTIEQKNKNTTDMNNNEPLIDKDIDLPRPKPRMLPLASSNPVFTFSSMPRSPRSGKRKLLDSPMVDDVITPGVEAPPEVMVSLAEDAMLKDPPARNGGRSQRNRGACLEDDFYKLSDDDDYDEDGDGIQKLLQSSLSPRHSPMPFHHQLRQSIRSSMLKEIPSPIKENGYDAQNYESENHLDTLNQSTASSWRFDTSDSSQSFNQTQQDLEDSLNSSNLFPKQARLITAVADVPVVDNDEDGHSDGSDDTTYSTWRAPPQDLRGNKYQNEMKAPGQEPDLTATMDPRDYCDVFSPPIILGTPNKEINGGIPILSALKSPHNSKYPGVNHPEEEEELDLLYDPCLNCYFDPKTHKYYELA